MLSILVPTFNTDCLPLVADLQLQCEQLEAQYGDGVFDYEILVFDDASTNETIISRNEMMEFLPKCSYERLPQNVGRAAIRNLLIDRSVFSFLLLIDADAEVCKDDFVEQYWQQRDRADVLLGGITNLAKAPRGCELRWRYEINAERKRTIAIRRAHPAAEFSVFNAFFHREVFEKIRFNENACHHYGYEDALLGWDIATAGFTILPVENPLRHLGMNPNVTFLLQTETALRTLVQIGKPMTEHARVARMWNRLRRLRLNWFYKWSFRILAPLLRFNLLSRHPSVFVLNLYKLGYYGILSDC